MTAYVNMVCDTMRNSLPKAVVHCQVREAKRSLLNLFYAQIGRKEVFGLCKPQLQRLASYQTKYFSKRVVVTSPFFDAYRRSNWVKCWMKIHH